MLNMVTGVGSALVLQNVGHSLAGLGQRPRGVRLVHATIIKLSVVLQFVTECSQADNTTFAICCLLLTLQTSIAKLM